MRCAVHLQLRVRASSRGAIPQLAARRRHNPQTQTPALRSGSRTRYTASATDPSQAQQITPRLKAAMQMFAPFQEIYIGWVSSDAPAPGIPPGGYPFKAELGGGSLTRHKMNLLFATCGQAEELIAKGYIAEAKRLLFEAAMLEPEADFVRDRIKALP